MYSCDESSQTMPAEDHGKPIVGKIRALDIMVERGKRAIMWEGNQRYTETVIGFIPEYKMARTNKEKTRVTESIVTKIRESGARFLKEHPKDSGTFVQVPPAFATKKVGQALRHFMRAQKQKEQRSKLPAARSKQALAAKKCKKSQGGRKAKASKQAVLGMHQTTSMKRNEAPLNENDWIRGCDMVPSDEEEESNLEALLSSESILGFEFVDDDVPMSVTSGGDSVKSDPELHASNPTAGFSVLRDATPHEMDRENGCSKSHRSRASHMKQGAEDRAKNHQPTVSRSSLSTLSRPLLAKDSRAPQFAFSAAQCGPPQSEIPRRISVQTVDLPGSEPTGITQPAAKTTATTGTTSIHDPEEMCTRPPRDDEEDFLQMIDSTLGPF